MSKILITGGSGLLGGNMAKLATKKFDVYATYNKNKVSMKDVYFFQIDLTKKEQLVKIERIKPDIIIHCAALTDVDFCEDHANRAYDQNVLASINIAEMAQKIGAYIIFISTESVFDGTKGDYKEDDIPSPINVYGRTKLEAERRISLIQSHSCIVRTTIYGWNMRNKFSFAEWALNKLTNNEELPAFKNFRFSPILVNDFIEALFKIQEKKYEGVIHIAGSEACNKLDFAFVLAKVFDLDKSLIKPVNTDELGLKAPRAKDVSLNVSKAEKILKEHLPKVKEGLEKMKKLRDEGYVEELKHGQTKNNRRYSSIE